MVRGCAVPWAIALVVNGSGEGGIWTEAVDVDGVSGRRPWMELEGNEMELGLGPDVKS